MDNTVILACAKCGAKNRIQLTKTAGTFRCGTCKAEIVSPFGKPKRRRFFYSATERFLRVLRSILAIALVAIPIVVIGYSTSHLHRKNAAKREQQALVQALHLADELTGDDAAKRSSHSRATTPYASPAPADKTKQIETRFTVTERSLPPNGEIVSYTTGKAVAPFGINSDTGTNYLLKLCDATTDHAVMTVFVRGGSTVKVKVPLGHYTVKYASGSTWYGYRHLFGPKTLYSKAEETFHFRVEVKDSKAADNVLRLMTELKDSDAEFHRYLISAGASPRSIDPLFNGEDAETGLKGLDRFDKDWWQDKFLGKISNRSVYNAIVKRLNARIEITNQLSAERAKATAIMGFNITLYKVSSGNLETEEIDAKEF